MDILKPYLLLASVAFTVGFTGYWAFGQVAGALTPAPVAVRQAPASVEVPFELFQDSLRRT